MIDLPVHQGERLMLDGMGVAQPHDEDVLDHVGTFQRISHHLLHHLKGVVTRRAR